jgi:hypothetical protein
MRTNLRTTLEIPHHPMPQSLTTSLNRPPHQKLNKTKTTRTISPISSPTQTQGKDYLTTIISTLSEPALSIFLESLEITCHSQITTDDSNLLYLSIRTQSLHLSAQGKNCTYFGTSLSLEVYTTLADTPTPLCLEFL